MKCSVSCLALCLLATAAAAQTAQRVTLAELGRDPERFFNHRIRVDNIGCFQTEESGFRCTTYRGAYLVPSEIVPASMKSNIRNNCGGINEAESDPACMFDVVFTPSGAEMGVGDVVANDESRRGPVWMVQAGPVTIIPHR